MAIEDVDEYGNDLSAPGYAPPFLQARDEARSKMAQQRAMKWRQRASALAAGLASAGGASNFGEGLLRGFSGSLAGAEKFSTGQEERDAVRAQGEQRQAQQLWERQYQQGRLGEEVRHNKQLESASERDAMIRANQQPHMTELDYFLKDPKGYKAFKDSGRADQGIDPDTALLDSLLDPQTLDMYAKQFAMTGRQPSMGFGKAGALFRAKVGNAAAHNYPGTVLAQSQAQFDTDKAALNKTKTLYDLNLAFKNTMKANVPLIMEVIDKIPNTGSPLINKPIRWMAEQAGNPDMSQYHAALNTVRTEIARIVQQASLSGQPVTIYAQKEIKQGLSDDATPAQLRRALQTLMRDADNKTAQYANQINAIQSRIGTNPYAGTEFMQPKSFDPEEARTKYGY